MNTPRCFILIHIIGLSGSAFPAPTDIGCPASQVRVFPSTLSSENLEMVGTELGPFPVQSHGLYPAVGFGWFTPVCLNQFLKFPRFTEHGKNPSIFLSPPHMLQALIQSRWVGQDMFELFGPLWSRQRVWWRGKMQRNATPQLSVGIKLVPGVGEWRGVRTGS